VRDRIYLCLYIAAVLSFTLVHDVRVLAGAIVLGFVLAGKDVLRISRKAARALFFFTSIVAVSYCIVSYVEGGFSPSYLVLITTRVFLLAFITFLLVARTNPAQALGFSRSLLFMVCLVQSQVLTMRRIYGEFRQALESRSLRRLKAREMLLHAGSTGAFLFEKSMADTKEIAHAMRSRGFFND
jgi:energy-coupling factor transporter transmembrane protein EcfT